MRYMCVGSQDDRGQKRLEFLLRQAEVFQHFAPDLADARKKKYVVVLMWWW